MKFNLKLIATGSVCFTAGVVLGKFLFDNKSVFEEESAICRAWNNVCTKVNGFFTPSYTSSDLCDSCGFCRGDSLISDEFGNLMADGDDSCWEEDDEDYEDTFDDGDEEDIDPVDDEECSEFDEDTEEIFFDAELDTEEEPSTSYDSEAGDSEEFKESMAKVDEIFS